MAITKDFLRDQMKRLEVNYGIERFLVTEEIFNLWLEMFQDCEEPGLKLAVDKCLRENEFAPNIAGLMKYYKEIENEHNELEGLIKRQYTVIRSIWGEEYDGDTFKALAEYVLRFPSKQRNIEVVEFTHKAVSFFHDCDAVGRKERPTIKEYIEGER